MEIQPRTSEDRCPVRVICQVTEVEPTPAVSPEKETIEDIIKKLLPTPAPPPLQAVPIRSDRDLLIQQLMEAIRPPTSDSAEGCFSCRGLTHTTDQCRTLDESFQFFGYGMADGAYRRQVHPGTGSPPGPRGQQTGNAD